MTQSISPTSLSFTHIYSPLFLLPLSLSHMHTYTPLPLYNTHSPLCLCHTHSSLILSHIHCLLFLSIKNTHFNDCHIFLRSNKRRLCDKLNRLNLHRNVTLSDLQEKTFIIIISVTLHEINSSNQMHFPYS